MDLTGGASPVFGHITNPTEPEEIEARVAKRLFQLQSRAGQSTWNPPGDRDKCLKHLYKFAHIHIYIPEMQELRTEHLPKLTLDTLRSFGLTCAQAIDFMERAKWIAVKQDMEYEEYAKVAADERKQVYGSE